MLVFTVIILARRLIAAIVKEVRILILASTFSELSLSFVCDLCFYTFNYKSGTSPVVIKAEFKLLQL